jgi:GPH family glycoside/pentoside/hexuronide:cation symporter
MKATDQSLHVIAPEDRIPLFEKIAYGAGTIGNAISSVPKYMATPLLVIYLGISPVWIGFVMSTFLVWDAFTDPFMGAITDNFRSRWGRRRPFLVLGAVLSALVLPLLYLFDPNWSHAAILTYFVLFGMLFYAADTVFNMPYQSMLLEMSPDYNERTSVSAYRGVFSSIAGLVMGWIWAFTQLPIFNDPITGEANTLTGARWTCVIAAVVLLIFSPLPGYFCKERYYSVAKKQKKEPIFGGIKKTLTCRPFLLIEGLMMLLLVSGTAVGSFGMYLLNYYIFAGDSGQASFYFGLGGTISSIVALAMVPVVVHWARKTSKEKVLWVVLASKAALAVAIWFCFDPARPWLTLIPPIFGVPILSALYIVLPSMIADAVDYDELKNNERREGIFSAVHSWVFKASMTLAGVLAGPLLVMTGFDAAADTQAMSTLFNMKLLMVSVPFFGTIGCIFVLKLYPITPLVAHDIRMQLEARRGKVSECQG